MGAGYVNLRGKRKGSRGRWDAKRKDPARTVQLAAFVLALRGTIVKTSTLYVCDNQALLKAVKRWAGEDVSKSAKPRHFTGSNRGAMKKKNSRSF